MVAISSSHDVSLFREPGSFRCSRVCSIFCILLGAIRASTRHPCMPGRMLPRGTASADDLN
jgi:hypothetical protein